MSLALRNVTYAYGDGPEVVTNFSLDVPAGRAISLVGPSGSGKSTLLAIAGLILKPRSGDVVISGHHAWQRRSPLKTGSSEISWVFQSLPSLANRTVLDNTAIALLVRGSSRSDAEAQAHAALQSVGLGEFASRRIEKLSGGQLQRVCVARAIVARPLLLIADEPTGQLDRANSAAVTAALIRACEDFSVPMLIATHDERVATSCHEVVEL